MKRILVVSAHLTIVVEDIIEEAKRSIPLGLCIIIGAIILMFSLAYLFSSWEIIAVSIFLITTVLVFFQNTEIHFNKISRKLYYTYTFLGFKVFNRQLITDYTICQFSIVHEEITPMEDTYEVYTLRATEFYYHYNTYHFKNLNDAELVAHWLVKNAGITLEEYIKDH